MKTITWHNWSLTIQIIGLYIQLSVSQALQINFSVTIAFNKKAMADLSSKQFDCYCSMHWNEPEISQCSFLLFIDAEFNIFLVFSNSKVIKQLILLLVWINSSDRHYRVFCLKCLTNLSSIFKIPERACAISVGCLFRLKSCNSVF